MVAKDTATGSQSVPINPLNLTTPEEKYLFSLGEKNIARRRKLALDSLFKVPPRQEENAIIHKGGSSGKTPCGTLEGAYHSNPKPIISESWHKLCYGEARARAVTCYVLFSNGEYCDMLRLALEG